MPDDPRWKPCAIAMLLVLTWAGCDDTGNGDPGDAGKAGDAGRAVDAGLAVDAGPAGGADAGPTAPSHNLLEYAIDVAEDREPWDPAHADALLQAYEARAKRRLSEPQYISDLSFVWLLARSELTADGTLESAFCEAYLTRLSNLLTEGEIFTAPPAGADSPAAALAAVQSGTWSPVYGGRTANNRHAREAAALAIASLIVHDAKTEIDGCLGVSLSDLFAPGSPLELARIAAIDQIFAPTGNWNVNKYTLITSDGAYKEGAGYLDFTNQVLMPMVFFTHHYTGVNLFEASGDYTVVMPERLRALFGWLRGSQDDDGQWSAIEDAGRLRNGRSFSTAVGVYMMRHLSASMPDLRKNLCGMLGRSNRFLYYDELQAACLAGAEPLHDCGYLQHVRLAGLLFAPDASGGPGSLHDAYGIAVPQQCGAYYREGTPQYREGPAQAHYPIGGHLFLRSSDSNAIQVRLYNAGSWFEPGGAAFDGYTSGGTTYSAHASCDAAFLPVGGAKNRECHYWINLRTWFSTASQPLDWHPRTANHKRYHDSHFELRAFGKDLLIGSGKMGYISETPPVPYEEWNSPTQYNLTRTRQRWPKTLYLQGAVNEKLQLVSSRPGCGQLYRMRTDTYDRYVLWAHQRYLLVTDRIRASGALYMQASFHIRGEQSYRNTPSGRLNTIYRYVDKTTAGSELTRDDNTRLQIHALVGGLVDTEDVARDSCQDDTYLAHADEGYCQHPVLRIASHADRPQKMLPFVLWPYRGADAPSLSFANAITSGDALESIDLHITAAGVDDTWTIDAANLAGMLDGGSCGS